MSFSEFKYSFTKKKKKRFFTLNRVGSQICKSFCVVLEMFLRLPPQLMAQISKSIFQRMWHHNLVENTFNLIQIEYKTADVCLLHFVVYFMNQTNITKPSGIIQKPQFCYQSHSLKLLYTFIEKLSTVRSTRYAIDYTILGETQAPIQCAETAFDQVNVMWKRWF